MTLGAKERKELSKLGAVRIPRDRPLMFVQSNKPTQNVWPMMVGCKIKDKKTVWDMCYTRTLETRDTNKR
eukprot:6345092-Heterocapsa_arctica.AAC.1